MSRVRIAAVIGVLVVFAVVGGFLIRANQHQGGQHVTFDVTVTGAKTMSPRGCRWHTPRPSTSAPHRHRCRNACGVRKVTTKNT